MTRFIHSLAPYAPHTAAPDIMLVNHACVLALQQQWKQPGNCKSV